MLGELWFSISSIIFCIIILVTIVVVIWVLVKKGKKEEEESTSILSEMPTPRIITKQLGHGSCRWCGKSLSKNEAGELGNECWSCTDDTRGPAAPKGQRSGHR